MGASFRNAGEIEQLAGCDRLTISPPLLEALKSDTGELPRKLDPARLGEPEPRLQLDEVAFRWALNEDPMATGKTGRGHPQLCRRPVCAGTKTGRTDVSLRAR